MEIEAWKARLLFWWSISSDAFCEFGHILVVIFCLINETSAAQLDRQVPLTLVGDLYEISGPRTTRTILA